MITKNLKKSTTPKKLLLVAAVLIVLVSTFLMLEATGITHFIDSFNTKTNVQVDKDQTNTNNKTNDINTGSTTPPEPTANDINLSARREADGSVTILTELKNYSDGTCDLTIKNGNDSYTKTAPVLYQASFSTCEGFSIPSNEVQHGTWQITLKVTSKGKTESKTISVEVK